MNSQNRRILGKSKAWLKSGVHVLHLRGTLKEMAAQHGMLLSEQIRTGALPYLGEKNRHLLEQSHLFKNRPWAVKLAQRLIHIFIHKPMLAHTPRHYLEEAHAMADAAGIPYEYVHESIMQPDTLVLLVRYFMGRHVLGHLGGGFPGCTSVVALGKATKSGGVIHARNFDYPCVGTWDIHPTVFYCDPQGVDRGQRYIGIGTAGIHTAGVTSVNESGLTLAAHFHCAKAVSPFGTPIQFIGSEVVRKARTLGQAIDIVGDFERAGSWSFVVTSAKENAAAVIEMLHGKLAVREPENGMLAHTNHFRTPELQECELLLSAGVAADCSGRYHRALDLLQKSFGLVDRNTVARILGDHFDRETGRVRSQGNTISVITTVTSMIAEAAKGIVWVGNSGRSPTCLGDYAGFKIDETFEDFESHEPEILTWPTQGATTIRGTAKAAAFQVFREAYKAFHVDFDVAKAAESAQKAFEMDSEEGQFSLAHGHFRMRLGQTGRALEAFLAARRCVMGEHLMLVATIFEGHALDCLGRRDEATARYRTVFENAADPGLRQEARRCLRRPYAPNRAERITFDLQFCDCLEYA